MLLRLAVLSLFFPLLSAAQTVRFDAEKISFRLQDSEGAAIECLHRLLPHVPWWNVSCGKRSFTVDTWVQLQHHREMGLTKATLMYDVSEGTVSSGEKRVQFQAHFTHMYVESLTDLKAVSSHIDIQNGQKSLVMTGFVN